MTTTEAHLDLHRDAPVAMLDHEITDRRAWTRDTVKATDWTMPLSGAAIAEVLALADTLARQPLPVLMLSPDQFALPACREAMARVKATLRDGIGVKDTRLWMEFTIERGQLQYLNNCEFAHFRSEFKDDGRASAI